MRIWYARDLEGLVYLRLELWNSRMDFVGVEMWL